MYILLQRRSANCRSCGILLRVGTLLPIEIHLPTYRIGLSLFNRSSSQHAAKPIALWFLFYTIRSLVMVFDGTAAAV
jgi:hypothetical protein